MQTILALVLSLAAAGEAGWSHTGGDPGGQKYSAAAAITPDNVNELIEAWRFSTGDLERRAADVTGRSKFETTPILSEGRLVFCSPYNEAIALDPGTGAQLWRFDAAISTQQRPANRYNCRGVTAWHDPAATGGACASRIFMGTNDGRLFALDAATGERCSGFGTNGEVKIEPGMALEWPGEFQITSPPAVADGVVVVGSAISDNRKAGAPPGVVRAFDAVTGAPRWTFDPMTASGIAPGHANVWSMMSVDEERGLIFLPTSSPSPDFFGGERPGDNRDSDSVVALRIATGEKVWAFQTVHHDVWDYDLPAQPVLATLNLDGGPRDVVIQATKQGFIFVLDRDTGQPVWPVEERPVPQGGVEGETLSTTQPFPTHVPALVPQRLDADADAWGVFGFWDQAACRDAFRAARNDGLYTPPSMQGTLLFPMTGGGVNWGGVAFDPVRQMLYANTTRLVHRITLHPSGDLERLKTLGIEVGPQSGTPYAMTREVMLSPLGLPCNRPPWGKTVAVDLKAGRIAWEAVLGTTEDRAPLGIAADTGLGGMNGVAVTGGGVVFSGAGDPYLRAFAAADGAELWQGRLPAPGIANPMTYEWQGSQYVAIAAGGHSEAGTTMGDSVVAFRLPKAGESGPSWWSRTIDRPGGRFRMWMTVLIGGLIALTLLIRRMWRRRRRV
jgi:quinoprotein glucose dehydrogenase